LSKLLRIEGAVLAIYEPSRSEIRVEMGRSAWQNAGGRRIPFDQGITGQVIRSGRPYIEHQTNGSLHITDLDLNGDMTAIACVPLIAQEQTIGVIWVGKRSAINANDLRLLTAIADIAANAIHRANILENLQHTNLELSRSYDETIQGWSSALDLRDRETEGHTLRVADLTLKLAQVVGIGEPELVQIRRGSLLHDIGKMGIPDAILHKPGPLDPAEWEIMRQHPDYAYRLLSPIAYLRPALDIPYCHHEKWDGSGYPRGLKGEEIPLAARLFALVDVWDALRSDRPYRMAYNPETAIQYIREQAGKHFDPLAAQIFLDYIQT
jgi:putative nucleotidyltransferase with HDIG domain